MNEFHSLFGNHINIGIIFEYRTIIYCHFQVESKWKVSIFNQYVMQLWYDAFSMPFPFIQNDLFDLLDFPGFVLLVNENQSAFYWSSFEVYDNDVLLSCIGRVCLFLLPILSPFSTATTTSKDIQHKRWSNKRAF